MTVTAAASPAKLASGAFPWLEGVCAGVCSRFETSFDPAWTRRVGTLYKPPAWVAQGSVSGGDAMFLYSMVRCLKPRRIVEIGVASGCSSSVLAAAASDAGRPMPDERHEPVVHGFDILDHVYYDRTRPVGSALHEMIPELAGGVRFHPGLGAADAAALFASEPLTFAFIDADHNHPWPTADLLALAPALAPGAWVALHDLSLPKIARDHEARSGEKVTWGTYGPRWLFDHWPFEKLAGEGEGWNIGAVRMPLDRPLRREDLTQVIGMPWEADVDERAAAVLGRPARRQGA